MIEKKDVWHNENHEDHGGHNISFRTLKPPPADSNLRIKYPGEVKDKKSEILTYQTADRKRQSH